MKYKETINQITLHSKVRHTILTFD